MKFVPGASTSDDRPILNKELAKMNAELSGENWRLQKMLTRLQSENDSLCAKVGLTVLWSTVVLF